MLFNTLEFAIFVPAVFTIYWILSRQASLRNLWLILASYLFYGSWSWKFLLLIIFTTITTYGTGILIDRSRTEHQSRAKIWLLLNVIINLSILCLFKYFDFFSKSLAEFLNMLGLDADNVTLNLVLPVGISFYTIQAIGYSIDVYQRRTPACRNPISFFTFICFFPQLVAGPIERATNLLPQFNKKKIQFNYADAATGCRQILWGLFKKAVVADSCAVYVDAIFKDFNNLGSYTLIIGAILFAFQVYGDFSGYSDIAIGTGRLFGIRLMDNFRSPFLSRSMRELWQRWHISLNKWLTDYIYIPLGGSRCGTLRAYINILIIFFISGLWHGANYTFIVWGLFFGLMLIIERLLFPTPRKTCDRYESKYGLPVFKDAVAIAICFTIFIIGHIIFRAPEISVALSYIWDMLTRWDVIQPIYGPEALKWCLLVIVVEWIQRNRAHVFDIDYIKPALLRYIIYWALIWAIHEHSMTNVQFIYFQF